MKYTLFSIALVITFSVFAQKPLIDRNGTASFFSEAPMENIEASNNQALGALDLSKGTLAASMLMKGFRFEKALMEEHFNENYVESDKFPKASFKGTLKDIDKLDFSATGTFEATAEGDITIHGVTKPLTAKVTFTVDDSSIKASSVFPLTVADFEIDIPKLVTDNIAKEVETKVSFQFTK